MPTRKWGSEFVANTSTPGNQTESSVTALADGGFAIAWRDEGPIEDVVRWQRFSATGAKVGAEITTSTFGGGNQSEPTITTLADGTIWIAQSDFDSEAGLFHSVIGEVFTPSGISVGTLDGAYGAIDGVGYGSAASASLGSNGSVVAFVRTEYDAGGTVTDRDVVLRGFNAAGVQTFLFENGDTTNQDFIPTPSIAVNPSGTLFVVSVQQGFLQLLNHVYTSNGAPVTSFEPNIIYVEEFSPVIAWLNDERILTVWTNNNAQFEFEGDGSGSSIKFTIIDYAGNTISAESIANLATHGNQTAPAVAVHRDGWFVIAWVDESLTGGDSQGSSIRLQTFNSSGGKIGGEILVNTQTSGTQTDVAMSTLADGRVIVTWTDASATGGDTTGTAIRAQIIDPRDGIVSGTDSASLADTLYGNDLANDEMNGYAGSDVLYGLAGADTIFGSTGNDTLQGGRGDDTLFGGADQDSMLGGLGADEMDGGDGVDTANYALAAFSVTASLDGTLLGTNEALDDTYVSIENLTGTNIAAQGDTLRGNAAANSIAGLAGADFLNGVSGHDRLTGGTGVDTMTGGVGNDSFIYNTLTEGGDIITDFSSFAANNNDVFRFKGSVFGGLAAGAITAPQFQSSTADVAANTNIRFFYETDTRILRFDADGSDPSAAVIIATLQTGATMTFNDILIF